MTYFAIVAGVILIWMFLAPKEVGKWYAQAQGGYDDYLNSLATTETTEPAEKEKM